MSLFLDHYINHPHHFSSMGMFDFVLLLAVILLFELWMLIDVLAYHKMPRTHRMWWVVGMFVLHPFVAIAYFFARNNYKRA
jgi:hypothetical protein